MPTVISRLRSPLTWLVLCLQLVLAVRAPAAVVGVRVGDVATSAVATRAVTTETVSGHAHHHHGAPTATTDAAEDSPSEQPGPHDGHEGGGCHGGLPCCASTLLAAGVRDVTACQRFVSDATPTSPATDLATGRVTRRQPPATAPPVLG
jgi:hypothetical protein